MRFVYAVDGTAINVAHIVTIYPKAVDRPKGFVIRCRTTLADGQYAVEHGVLTLSPVLEDEYNARLWMATVIDKLNPL